VEAVGGWVVSGACIWRMARPEFLEISVSERNSFRVQFTAEDRERQSEIPESSPEVTKKPYRPFWASADGRMKP